VARAARVTPAFTLSAACLAHSPTFFHCVFLELARPEPVLELRGCLGPALGRRPEDAARPHVSLVYAELPRPEREELCRELDQGALVATPIRFDALALVAPRRDEDADWSDVEGWRIVGPFPLAAG